MNEIPVSLLSEQSLKCCYQMSHLRLNAPNSIPGICPFVRPSVRPFVRLLDGV